MNRSIRLITLGSALLAAPLHATPEQARLVREEFKLSNEAWSLAMRVASTPEEREAASQKQPDAGEFAARMWQAIGPSLKEPWTLEPMAWFLRVAPSAVALDHQGQPVQRFTGELEALRAAVETHHLQSPGVGPVCLALGLTGDPTTVALLEKIAAANPDPKTQGVAALAAAMALKGLGDDAPIMKRRINHLRKAIIESADLVIDGVQVAKLAEDELHIIIHLTKGRVAPDLVGEDSAKRPMKLSDQAGKVVVLLFWGSQHADAERTLDFANGLVTKFRGRPFALVGVNHDPVEQLRALQAEGTVDWPNFSDPQNLLSAQYKIGSFPLAYVLDHERKVQYAGPMNTFVELTAGALLDELQNPGAR